MYLSTADILLLPVLENRGPLYYNSTSGFDFDLFTAIGIWFSIGTPNFIEIDSSSAELWRHSDFQHGCRPPCWIWFRVIVAHPQSASGVLCFILRCRFHPIYYSGDSAIFMLRHFGLKLYSRPVFLWGGGGWDIFFEMTLSIVLAHNRHFLARIGVVWAIKRKNPSSSTWVPAREHHRTVKKVTKALYFTYFWRRSTKLICIKISQ